MKTVPDKTVNLEMALKTLPVALVDDETKAEVTLFWNIPYQQWLVVTSRWDESDSSIRGQQYIEHKFGEFEEAYRRFLEFVGMGKSVSGIIREGQ